MKFLGNLLWIIFGGLIASALWLVLGCLWCVTIIGIPVGLQCFKFAKLCLLPFGKEIVYGDSTASVLVNIFWLLFGGLEFAFGFFAVGCFFQLRRRFLIFKKILIIFYFYQPFLFEYCL